MELLLLLIQIPFLIVLIKYLRKKHSDPLLTNSYYFILSFKVTAGIFLGLLYFNYYKEGDTIAYYLDLENLSNIFYTNKKEYINIVFYIL